MKSKSNLKVVVQHPLDYIVIDDKRIDMAYAANLDGVSPSPLYMDDQGILWGQEFILATLYPGVLKDCPKHWTAAHKAAHIITMRGSSSRDINRHRFHKTKMTVTGHPIESRKQFIYTIPRLVRMNTHKTNPEIETEGLKTRVQPGQTWCLGGHYLYCGSNMDIPKYLYEMADHMITDPPYAINFTDTYSGYNANKRIKLHGDTTAGQALPPFPFHLLTKPGSSFHVFYAAGTVQPFLANFPKDWRVRDLLTWDKGSTRSSRMRYGNDKEIVIYGGLPGKSRAPVHSQKDAMPSILRYRRLSKNNHHPTEKPVGLMKRIIEYNTHYEDYVIDPYAGGGSTLLACELSGRGCIAAEYEPHYCDLILERWEKETGQEAHWHQPTNA